MPRRRQPKPKPTPEELPPCDGSKLHLFKYHDAEIQWFERLGDNEDRGTPTEGYIFRASIRGREYAVKVVSKDTAEEYEF